MAIREEREREEREREEREKEREREKALEKGEVLLLKCLGLYS